MSTEVLKPGEIGAVPGFDRPSWPDRQTLMIGALAMALLAAIAVAVDLSRRPAVGASPPLLVVAPLVSGPVAGTIQASGALAPAQVTVIAQTSPGQLTHVLVKPGERVSKGQVLARFDPLALRAELALAEARVVAAGVAALEAEVELAARGLQRTEDGGLLLPEGEEQPNALEMMALARAGQAASQAAASQAAYRVATQRLAQGIVRAPKAGMVLQRHANQGDIRSVGAPLFLLATDPMTLQLEVSVPEAASAQVQVGQEVEFAVPAFPGRRFAGQVQQLLPLIGPETARRLPAIIAVVPPTDSLRAGMTASATIRTAKNDRSLVRVPSAALHFSPNGTKPGGKQLAVWIIEGERQQLRQVPVQVGASEAGFSEISGQGLREGTPVAVGYAPSP